MSDDPRDDGEQGDKNPPRHPVPVLIDFEDDEDEDDEEESVTTHGSKPVTQGKMNGMLCSDPHSGKQCGQLDLQWYYCRDYTWTGKKKPFRKGFDSEGRLAYTSTLVGGMGTCMHGRNKRTCGRGCSTHHANHKRTRGRRSSDRRHG